MSRLSLQDPSSAIRHAESGLGALVRCLGGSAIVHAALLAVLVGLGVWASERREPVLRVSLITVDARLVTSEASRSLPGPEGPEGAGRLGGDGRRAGPRRAANTPPAAPGRSGGPPAAASEPAAREVRASREIPAVTPRPAVEAESGAAAESPPLRVIAGPLPHSGSLYDPIPKDLGPNGGALPRLDPAASTAGGESWGGVGHGAGPGQGLGRGGGRGLGATAGPGSGVAGSGPGAGAAGVGPGRGGPARPPDLADLLARIRGRIEAATRYPEEARREGIQGNVHVRFRLREDGQVEAVEIARSSGSRLLDEASLETIRRAAPYPPVRGWVRVPIAYTLSEADR